MWLEREISLFISKDSSGYRYTSACGASSVMFCQLKDIHSFTTYLISLSLKKGYITVVN